MTRPFEAAPVLEHSRAPSAGVGRQEGPQLNQCFSTRGESAPRGHMATSVDVFGPHKLPASGGGGQGCCSTPTVSDPRHIRVGKRAGMFPCKPRGAREGLGMGQSYGRPDARPEVTWGQHTSPFLSR